MTEKGKVETQREHCICHIDQRPGAARGSTGHRNRAHVKASGLFPHLTQRINCICAVWELVKVPT